MGDRKPRVELVPWDFDSQEHQERMYLQRLACGWRSEEVQKWVELGRAATKTLYWIVCISPGRATCAKTPRLSSADSNLQKVLRDDLAGREELISQHLAENPKASTRNPQSPCSVTRMKTRQPRPAAPSRTFVPIGHVALDLRGAENQRLGLTGGGIVWVAGLYVSYALQRHGLGREVMGRAERLASRDPSLGARWIVLDTMPRGQQLSPAFVEKVYLAQGRPAPALAIQDWYEGQGYEVFAEEAGGYKWANPETGEREDIDYIFLRKRQRRRQLEAKS
ncbi:hypothetical protein VPNG_03282 [Cytospora leucostoma]|uniref:N-acetyltransferase domain-containing protein n=1 Tax=Cytospora leucostoma TaxID=1230097 RepID=A0A423XEP0_9PEZI|nr:hypothetical protein VPNG_03282 [Cytospora leucostoma]